MKFVKLIWLLFDLIYARRYFCKEKRIKCCQPMPLPSSAIPDKDSVSSKLEKVFVKTEIEIFCLVIYLVLLNRVRVI